jgi:hypothetical protein
MTMIRWGLVAGLCAWGVASATPRATPPLQHAAMIHADGATTSLRPVGRHVLGLRDLACPYNSDPCTGAVLDLDTLSVTTLHPLRVEFESTLGAGNAFGGQLVYFDAAHDVAGYRFGDWYVAVDTTTNKVKRTARIASSTPNDELHVLGFDAKRDAVWFWVEHFAGPRDPHDFTRPSSSSSITLRRLDLATLAASDITTMALTSRPQRNLPMEDERFVHASADYTRFAVIDYWEDPHPLSPPAEVVVADTQAGATFTVTAPPVTYAATFAPDGHLYLSSEQTGKLVRVDVAAHKVDRTVNGPKSSHTLLVTPDGAHLIVASTSRRFVAFDLPSLSAQEYAHDPDDADAFGRLSSDVGVSADGKFAALGAGGDAFDIVRLAAP